MSCVRLSTRGNHLNCTPQHRRPITASTVRPARHVCSATANQASADIHRRHVLAAAPLLLALKSVSPAVASNDFTTLPSGLVIQEERLGEGAVPRPGDLVSVHWAGYTKNYQSKRIDNTSKRDEPYEFVLGKGEAIPAFEEAVATMHVGGIRRVIVPGELPELSYPRDRSLRYNGDRYRLGPQPAEFDGQRALDFVLDNGTLADTNRTLLFDIKLLAVRKRPVTRA